MATNPATTADEISENFKALVDRMVDAKFTQEVTKRGNEVCA